MPAISCPDSKSLQRFVLGQLPEDLADNYAQHLAQCQRCVQTLSDLKLSDTLLDALREASSATVEKPLSKDVETLIARFRRLPTEAALAKDAPTIDGPPTLSTGASAGAIPPAVVLDQASEVHDFLAPLKSADEIGRLGNYRVLKVLGSGGMGTVFLAEDPHLQRHVALKAMKPSLAASASARERFLREARATAKVKHDHIVTIHQVGEDQGVPFIAMELLEGETLDDLLHRETKLPLADALRIGREIAVGLAAAHRRNLLHRDIKPANIWLEVVTSDQWSVASEKTVPVSSLATGHWPLTTSRVKIVDFGLARSADQESKLTQQGAIVGTPAYMAPEQATGTALDHRCDLFSLGCVIYRMTTGQPPFRGTDSISTLVSVATDRPTPPCEIDANIPQSVSDFIIKLLAKKPDERPASAHAVADELARLQRVSEPRPLGSGLQGDATVAVAPKPLTDVRGSDGNRRKWLIAAATLLALIGGGWYLAHIIIRLPGEHGELVVEVMDKDLETLVGHKELTFRDVKNLQDKFSLVPGDKVVIFKDAAGNEMQSDELTLKKGATTRLRAWMEPNRAKPPLPVAVPVAHKDNAPRFKNTLGMEFTLVPKGKAWLGGGGGKAGDKEVEFKDDFFLGVYEVTQEEWEKVIGANPSHFSRKGGGKDRVKDIADADLKRFPVEQITWHDAQLFLEALNERDKESGWVHRLPTEAEWEYACRGGPASAKVDFTFNYYLDKPTNQLLPEHANFDLALKRTSKVGSYKPNRLGLYDMHGNILEWCEDEYVGRDGVVRRMLRGGAWSDGAINCTAALRNPHQPEAKTYNTGLRVARVRVATAPDRRAAEWVLSIGGLVEVNGVQRYIKAVGDLPTERFDLTFVSLHGKPVSDAALANLRDLRRLKHLGLSYTQVTNAGLDYLKDLKGLTVLGLGATKVTDTGLAHLKGLTGLTSLKVTGAKVTAKGLADFQAAVPYCKIEWDGGTIEPARFTNTLGMEFALVPKGKAWLGGGGGKPGDKEVEFKDDFYLGVYEVTQEEWTQVMGANPSHFSRKRGGKDQVKDIAAADLKRFPVEQVSWNHAQEFLEALNQRDKQSGWVYRLPTEWEWEYACRGGPMSARIDSIFDYYLAKPTNTLASEDANFNRVLGRTCKIGSYAPNRLGLYDMHGNVLEWCDDEVQDDKGARQRVIRGGSWHAEAGYCRAAFHNAHASVHAHDYRGFRVARVGIAADPDRRAAEWVLSIGGWVIVDSHGQALHVRALKDLPSGTFRVIDLVVRDNKKLQGADLREIRGSRANRIYLDRSSITDQAIVAIATVSNLQNLSVSGTGVSDAFLVRIAELTQLALLELQGTKVGDGGLKHLHKTKLNRVDVRNTFVTEAGVKALIAALPNCTIVADHGTFGPGADPDRRVAEWVLAAGGAVHVTSQGKDALVHAKEQLPPTPFEFREIVIRTPPAKALKDADLQNLRPISGLTFLLALSGHPLTDAGVAELASIPGLAGVPHLDLSGAPLTDASSVHLQQFKKLRGVMLSAQGFKDLRKLPMLDSLSLANANNHHLAELRGMPLKSFALSASPNVDDAGLEHLRSLKGLSTLDLRSTKASAAGVKKLAAALPKCKIESDHGTLGPSSAGPRFTNTLGMEFALVSKGKAWLGGGGKPGDKEVKFKDDFYLPGLPGRLFEPLRQPAASPPTRQFTAETGIRPTYLGMWGVGRGGIGLPARISGQARLDIDFPAQTVLLEPRV